MWGQVSPVKVFLVKYSPLNLSHCHHLINAFKEHLLFDETPQVLNTSPSFNF